MGKSSSVGEKAPAGSKKTRKKMATKTKWIILFSGFGVLIIGLVIAIVVVAVTRGSADSPQTTPVIEPGGMNDEELDIKYNEISADIIGKMLNEGEQQYSGEDILELYKQKIEEISDKRLKAMIEADYYTMMLSVYPDEDKKGEIMDGLIKTDDVLRTARSALMVANGASWYNDSELEEKYTNIAYDRMGLTEEVRKNMQAEDEETAG